MDHKRALDGDRGTEHRRHGNRLRRILITPKKSHEHLHEDGIPSDRRRDEQRGSAPSRGCLYFGLMLTPDGPKVIEYNCRFGDPETQVVLPLLESDLLTVMRATTDGTLESTEVRFSDRSACCVVAASDGYPKKYETGFPLTVPDDTGPRFHVCCRCLRERQRTDGHFRRHGSSESRR